jgi:uncharacterized membrane protein YvbJ
MLMIGQTSKLAYFHTSILTMEAFCKSCKQWTKRIGNADDACEHCGTLLEADRISYQKEKEKIKLQSEAESLLLIREEDSERKRKLKKAAVWARVIFLLLVVLVCVVVFGSHG